MVKKIPDQHKFYKSISTNESTLLNAVVPFVLFSTNDVKRVTGWSNDRVHNTLKKLKIGGIITSVKRDSFVLTEKIPEHIFTIAMHAAAPAYISFWTAASYYGFTEQQVQSIQLVSTKQYKFMSIGKHHVEICTYKPERFYGYVEREGFAIAEPEKLLVDILYKPEKTGGIAECKKIIKASWESIDKELLLVYLAKFKNNSLYARLGYILNDKDSAFSKKIKKYCPNTLVLLNPQKGKTSKYDLTWGLNLNDE